MNYLVTQIVVFLLLAAVLGLIVGWLVKHRQTLSERRQRAEEWKDQLIRIEHERDELQFHLKSNETQLESVLREQADFSNDHREMVRLNEESSSVIENLQQSLQREQHETEDRLTALREKASSAHTRAEKLQQTLNRLEAEGRDKDNVQLELEQLQDKFTAAVSDFEARDEELRRMIALREKDRSNHNQTLEEVNHYLATANAKVRDLQQALDERELQLNQANDDLAVLRSVIENQQQDLREAETNLVNMKSALAGVQEDAHSVALLSAQPLGDSPLNLAEGDNRFKPVDPATAHRLLEITRQAKDKISELKNINKAQMDEILQLKTSVSDTDTEERVRPLESRLATLSSERQQLLNEKQRLQEECDARGIMVETLQQQLQDSVQVEIVERHELQDIKRDTAYHERELNLEVEDLQGRLSSALLDKSALDVELQKMQRTEELLLRKSRRLERELEQRDEAVETIATLKQQEKALKKQLTQVHFHADKARKQARGNNKQQQQELVALKAEIGKIKRERDSLHSKMLQIKDASQDAPTTVSSAGNSDSTKAKVSVNLDEYRRSRKS